VALDIIKGVSKKPDPAVPKRTPAVGPGWTMARGGPQRTGRATRNGPRKADLKWVFRTQGRVYADVTVTPDNTIYVASHDRHLYAVGPDGREIWSYDSGGKIWSTPAVSTGGTIYFGTDTDRLVALKPNGREDWVFFTKPGSDKASPPDDSTWDLDTSPLLMSDGTIAFGCHLHLYTVRPSGLLRWAFNAGTGGAKVFSSPALGPDGSLYFGTQGRYFFALGDGAKVLWSIKTGGDNDSSPAVGDDGTVYFGSDDGHVRAVFPDGRLRWKQDLGHPVRAPIAIAHNGTVYAATFGTRPFLAALDGKTGRERWRFHIEPGKDKHHGIQSGALVDPAGYIYFGGRDHYIYCLSPDGKLVWRHLTGAEVDSSPSMGPDGTLYIGSDDKRVYAFAPDAEKQETK
jgi:outer membrane protein assembly factor BamB